jgi:hypothetical protein
LVETNLKRSGKTIVFFISLLSISLFLPISFAVSGAFGLLVQNIDINPKSVILGDNVTIKFDIKNNDNNTVSCLVTSYCGGSCIDTQEVTIPSRSESPLFFKLNTTTLNTGNYSIESLIQISVDQQKMFNLGNIQVNSISTTSNPTTSNPIASVLSGSDFFIILFLILVILAGALVLGLILKRRKGKNQGQANATEQLSNSENPVNPDEKITSLFDEILKVDENRVGDETSSDDEDERKRKRYVKIARARAILES